MKQTIKKLFALILIFSMIAAHFVAGFAAGDAPDGIEIDSAFPDLQLREYVNYFFDKNNDGFLSVVECQNVESINTNDAGISVFDYTGIEHFPNLRLLSCKSTGDKPVKLDVSKNINLIYLLCYGVGLSELDVGNNPKLEHLDLRSANLTKLELGNNTVLRYLHCHMTPLETLDISGCPLLAHAVRNVVFFCMDSDGVSYYFPSLEEAMNQPNILSFCWETETVKIVVPKAARLITSEEESFSLYKTEKADEVLALLSDDNSDTVNQAIQDCADRILALPFDDAKTCAENKDAIDALVNALSDTIEAIRADEAIQENPDDPQDGGLCSWCGEPHDGFFGKIVLFFHSLFVFISLLSANCACE